MPLPRMRCDGGMNITWRMAYLPAKTSPYRCHNCIPAALTVLGMDINVAWTAHRGSPSYHAAMGGTLHHALPACAAHPTCLPLPATPRAYPTTPGLAPSPHRAGTGWLTLRASPTGSTLPTRPLPPRHNLPPPPGFLHPFWCGRDDVDAATHH